VRILAGIRVSRSADESTSPERQLAAISSWAKSRGHEITGQAIDLDVSGYKTPPWERPDIGAWLANRTSEFDIVAWARLDRAVRRMADMSKLAEWAKQHQKTLAFCSGPGGTLVLDMTSGPVAELIAMVLAFAAELEAQSIQERTIDSRAYLRKVARYAGGWVPFGYRPAALPGGKGFILEHDPVYAPILRQIVDDVIAGISANEIARRLNDGGVPTSRDVMRLRNGILTAESAEAAGTAQGGRTWWRGSNIISQLRGGLLRAITEYDDQVVRDESGLPVRFAEPIIDDDKWRQLQSALDRASKPTSGQRSDAAFLLRIAYCACGSPLYSMRCTVKGKTYLYYRCHGRTQLRSGCPSLSVRADWLNERAEKIFLEQVGHVEVFEKVTIPGDNHAAELAAVGQAITELVSDRFVRGIERDDYDTLIARLQAEHARLTALPAEPDQVVQRSTGRTFAEHWAACDLRGRRQLMLDAGFLLGYGRTRGGEVIATALDQDLARRASLAAEGTHAELPYGKADLIRALSGAWEALCASQS
jgi:site-specific DNA recombinase